MVIWKKNLIWWMDIDLIELIGLMEDGWVLSVYLVMIDVVKFLC